MARREASLVHEAENPAKPLRLTRIEVLLDQMNEVHERIMRRAFELFEGDGRNFGRELDHWLKAETELLHPVRLNMTETEEMLVVRAEVPGFTEKEIQVALEPRRLTITGKHELEEEKKKGKVVWKERQTEEILRVVELPADVYVASANATLSHGVLEIQMPKVAIVKNVRVQSKAA